MSVITKPDTVYFSSKGRVIIPRRLRKEFEIEEGTRAQVQSTPQGILITPINARYIRSLRGKLKRKPGDKPFAEQWAEYKKSERALEDRDKAKGKRPTPFSASVGRALRRSARVARKTARMHSTPIYVWRDGKVVALKP